MSDTQRDFFISRAGENADIAIQIAEILRGAGYSTFVQDQDFGKINFMARMGDGFAMVDRGARVIAVLSPHYLKKEYCLAEAQYPLTGDPSNRQERLIVLRVSDCAPTGFLKGIPYVDLVPLLLNAEGFSRAVRNAVAPRGQAGAARVLGVQVLHAEIRGVPGFTGREAELEAVEAALWRKGGKAALTNVAAVSAAVKGLGGVGKSVLAQEYAWRNRGRYGGVWWIRAEKAETLLDDLIELGARFIPGIKEVPDRAQAAQAALDHIAQMRGEKPWLLVYDNVEQPGDLEKLTPVDGAHVLITTRWSDWGRAAAPVKIGVFPADVAAQFLLDSTERIDRAGAEKLAAALGFLPLALDHAAAYCRRTGIGFDTYRELAADLIRKVPRGADYAEETPVFATFELAIEKATEACPAAETLMGICAFLAPERIPLDIVTADVMSEIERGEAVAALQEVSLVALETLDDGSNGISVHRLVQEVMRGRLRAFPSPIEPEARLRHDVGEGQGGGDGRTSAVGIPPTPIPSPQGGGEASEARAVRNTPPAPNGHGRIIASPLARRLSKEAGLDLAALAGSGPRGRIVKRDVEAALQGGAAQTKAGTAVARAPSPVATALGVQPMPDDKILALYEKGSYEVLPHDGMRRIIAQRLTQSRQTIPDFYLTVDCRIDELLRARERMNVAAPREGPRTYKLSVNDFCIKAMALALAHVPAANVTWTEAGTLRHKYADVGVAVAIEGGLFTPIVRHAELKSLSEISNEMKDLAERARKRRLAPHEYQGGTTSISNLGMYGIKSFDAVINPPHATILAVGTGEKRPVVVGDKVEVATIMSCTLSCDHRVVDGAVGAELLNAFKMLIEDPVRMLV